MNRLQADCEARCEVVKQECRNTILNIEHLLQLIAQGSANIHKPTHNVMEHTNYLYDFMHFNLLLEQSLFSFNSTLEKFLKDNNLPPLPSIAKENVIVNKTDSFKTCTEAHQNNIPVKAMKNVENRYKEENRRRSITELLPKQLVHNRPPSCPVFSEVKSANYSSATPNKNTLVDVYYAKDTLENVDDSDSDVSSHISNHNTTRIVTNGNDNCIIDDDVVNLDLTVALDNNNKVIVEKTSNGIIQKLLKLKSQRSQQEPYIPGIPIPDLSFKPSATKGSTYATFSDYIDHATSENSSVCSAISTLEQLKQCGKPNKIQPKEFDFDSRQHTLELKDCRLLRVEQECIVSHVVSPSEFYIFNVDVEDEAELELLYDEMANYYTDALVEWSSKVEVKKNLHQFCAVYVTDIWYRGEILNWLADDQEADLVVVQLVDIGTICKVRYENLQPLTVNFCELRKCTQKCHLAYLYTTDSTSENLSREWSKKVIDSFQRMIAESSSHIFKITYVQKNKNKKSIAIDLINLDEEDPDKSVGQLCINAGLALEIVNDVCEIITNAQFIKQIKNAKECDNIDSEMSKDEMVEKFLNTNMVEEPQTVDEAIMHYNPRDEAETCRFIRPDGTCFKGRSCKLRHTPLRKDGFTSDKVLVYSKAFAEIVLPQCDETVSITITHIVNIETFYAQITKVDQNIVGLYSAPFMSLVQLMNKPDTVQLYKKLVLFPAFGELVIAKHWNGKWYRAQVRDFQTMEDRVVQCEVHIVDFGENVYVDMNNLREMQPDFLRLPFQAVECHFYNITHKPDVGLDKERDYIESTYLGEKFKARVIAAPGHLQVLLFDDSDEDVGKKIIEHGFAIEKTEHIFPAANSVLLVD